MGVKVSFDSVETGLTNQNKGAIFPGYNRNDSDFYWVMPESDTCARIVIVEYNTNFAITATDASTLTELIKLARGVIPLVSTNPKVNTLINGVDVHNSSINSVVDSESNSGSQEFLFVAKPCPEEPKVIQCYRITLLVIGTMIVTDADISDEEERAEITLTLSVRDKTKSKAKIHSKRKSSPVAFEERISVEIASEDPFSVYAKVDQYCQTDGPGVLGRDSASVIKIDFVKIIIETISCLSEKEEEEKDSKGNRKNKGPEEMGEPIIGENALSTHRKH